MISTTATSSKTSVGTSSGEVLAANGGRIGAAFVNDSDTVIYLGFGGTAVINEGIRLNAQGGSWEMPQSEIYTGQITAISSGASKNLTHVEFTQ